MVKTTSVGVVGPAHRLGGTTTTTLTRGAAGGQGSGEPGLSGCCQHVRKLTSVASNNVHRGSPPPGERQQGPLSFKQFLLQQHDDPSPEEAQERYRGYLVEYHGSEIKAEFAQTRNDER